MLKLTTLKLRGRCLVILAVVGAFFAGANVGATDASSALPGESMPEVGAEVKGVPAGERAPGCNDPYRLHEQNNSVTAQVMSMPCATEDRDVLALDRPGLTLQPLAKPAPAPRTEQPPRSISF